MLSDFGSHCEAGVTEPWRCVVDGETEPSWQCGWVQQLPGRGQWTEEGRPQRAAVEGASLQPQLACWPGEVDHSPFPARPPRAHLGATAWG